MQVEVEKAAFAATWRDEASGEVLGYTLGDTMCRSPRRPWALTIENEGDRLIAPCGQCPGCLEFLRRRLADRLVRKYQHTCAQLWLIRIWYPAELQAVISAKLHRRHVLELEPGFFRLGVDSFALLARSKKRVPPLLRRLGLRHHVEPVRLSRGRRAWRRLTSGLLVARAVYGEQVKRWYARGLPPAERLKWDVVQKAMQKPWRRRTGARVRNHNHVILVPPAIWSMDADRMKEYRAAAAAASSPEEVSANQRRFAELVAGVSSGFILEAPAQPALTREQVKAFYVSMAQRKASRASATPVAALTPSTLLRRGLQSSRPSGVLTPTPDDGAALQKWLTSGAPPPEMGRERDYEDWLDECWTDGRTRRAILAERHETTHFAEVRRLKDRFRAEVDAWLERMKSKLTR